MKNVDWYRGRPHGSRAGFGIFYAVGIVVVLIVGMGSLVAPSSSPEASTFTPFEVGASSNSTNGSNPQLMAGYDVTFTCYAGTITENGSTACHNQVVTLDMCGAGTCWYNIVGSGMGISVFVAWSSVGTDQSLHCQNQNCSQAKLTVTLPSGDKSATGSVTLTIGHSVGVTVRTFVNWDTDNETGIVEICRSGCTNYTNNQTASLLTNATYDLTAVDIESGFTFGNWSTNAGTLGSPQDTESTFVVAAAGVLAMMVDQDVSGTGGSIAAGYAYSTASASQKVTSVGANFIIPTVTNSGGTTNYSVSFWVGIDGFDTNTAPIWQLGVVYYWQPKIYIPFYEYYGDGHGCNPNVRTTNCTFEWSDQLSPGDLVSAQISTTTSTSTFSLWDNASHVHWTGYVPYAAIPNNAQWVTEGYLGQEYPPITAVNYSELTVDGKSISQFGGFVEEYSASARSGALSTYGQVVTFYVNFKQV